MSSASAVAEGALYFMTLTVFGCAAGVGLLHLLGFPQEKRNRHFLAPLAITILWALTGDLLVRFGLTMGQLAPPMWAVSMVLASIGAWAMLRDRALSPDRTVVMQLGSCAAATAVGMGKMLSRGLLVGLGSPNLDTFFYTTIAAGYWERGIGLQGPTLFFDQVGGYMLIGTFRNHTHVLLSFLSSLIEAGEPLFVRNLFVCWTLFTIGTSAVYFLRVSRAVTAGGSPLTMLYVWLVMGVGWAFVPSGVGNWDNGLFVAVTPVLAGLAFEPPGWRFVGALGVTAAYGFLTYPELAPIAGTAVAPFFVSRAFSGIQRPLSVLTQYAVAAVIALLLVAPALPSLWPMFMGQVRAAAAESKPGGSFAGGLVLEWWNPATWWALGPELGIPTGSWPVAAATLLTAIAAVGVIRAARSPRQPLVWSLLILGVLLTYFLAVERYGYAGYKILSVTWWLFALVLLQGAVTLSSVIGRTRWPLLIRSVAALLAIGALGVASVRAADNRGAYFFPAWSDQVLPTADELTHLRALARQQPARNVVVQGELLKAPALPWVLYALRSTPLRVYLGTKPEHPFSEGFSWNASTEPDGLLVTSNEGRSGARVLIEVPRFILLDRLRPAGASR